MGVLGDGVICLVQAVVFVYDILTFPLYTVSQRPWIRRGAINKLRSDVLEETEESVTIRAKPRMTKPLQVENRKIYDMPSICVFIFQTIFLYKY